MNERPRQDLSDSDTPRSPDAPVRARDRRLLHPGRPPEADGLPIRLVSAGRFRDTPHHACERRPSRDHLVIWVIAGKGRLTFRERSDAVPAGRLICLPAGEDQAYASDPDDPWDIAWLHFDGPHARASFDELAPDPPFRAMPYHHETARRFAEMIRLRLSPRAADRRLASRLAPGVLGMLIARSSPADRPAGPQTDPRVEALVRFIDARLAEPLDAETLAAEAGVSSRQLTRLFRDAFELTPVRYVTQQRIQRAAALLEETRLSVADVAGACGFDDPFHFSRRFRELAGMSPRAYRAAQRQTDRQAPPARR